MARSWCALPLATLILAACGSAAPAAAPSAGASLTPAMQSLYAAAKQEGAVIWEGAVLKDAADSLNKGFAARFPGIQATFNPLNEPQAPAQILTEASNGAKVVKSLDVARGS